MYRRIQFYGKTANIHGLRYVVDEKRNLLLRLLWLIVCVTSWVFMLVIFKRSYQNFEDKSISFVTETTYLDWNTTFPAVTICEITSTEIFWTPEPGEDYSPVQQFISEIIFYTGSCYACSASCDICDSFNLRDLARKYRKECRAILTKCKWNGVPFDCCEKFLPLDTEYGVCFSLNSLHTRKVPGSEMNLKSNRKTGPGRLFIESVDDVRMYFHAPEDVPFINSNADQRKDIALGETYNVTINIIEIENDEQVEDLPVEKKGCRFPWERTQGLRVHEHYSYSTCVVQCHADAHVELCNCTHHLMPFISEEDGFCDIDGLQCLTDNFETLNRLHAEGFSKPGLVCNCVPSCMEPEYSIVAEQRGMRAGFSEIFVQMQSLPTFRFKRSVVRTTLDLVVSIGGTAGLFFGASLLSLIELPYLLFVRR